MTALVEYLRSVDACEEAIAWVGDRTLARAWAECERGDWLLWLAHHAGVDRRLFVIAATDCAALALPYAGDDVAIREGVIAECYAWAHGERSDEEIRDAYDTAYVSYSYGSSAAANFATAAAYSAASAAFAFENVSYAAYACACAYACAYAYDTASAPSEWQARRADGLRHCADAVRAAIPLSALHAAVRP